MDFFQLLKEREKERTLKAQLKKKIESQARDAIGQNESEMHRRDQQKGHAIEHQKISWYQGPDEFDPERHKNSRFES